MSPPGRPTRSPSPLTWLACACLALFIACTPVGRGSPAGDAALDAVLDAAPLDLALAPDASPGPGALTEDEGWYLIRIVSLVDRRYPAPGETTELLGGSLALSVIESRISATPLCGAELTGLAVEYDPRGSQWQVRDYTLTLEARGQPTIGPTPMDQLTDNRWWIDLSLEPVGLTDRRNTDVVYRISVHADDTPRDRMVQWLTYARLTDLTPCDP